MTVRMKCQRCQGKGSVDHPRQGGGARSLWGHKIACPACRGIGKVAVR